MPKFGNHLAADVWAVATRTLTDISAEEIFDLPEIDSTYPGVTVQSGALANTFGSWAEMVADVGVGKRLIGVVLSATETAAAIRHSEFEFGEGAEGSESAITRAPLAWNLDTDYGAVGMVFVPLWRSLTDNARLSVRVRDIRAAVLNHYVAAVVA